MLTGRCLCGAIRFTADDPPKWTGYCHCESCRRHTGAPVSAYAAFETAKLRFTPGPPAYFLMGVPADWKGGLVLYAHGYEGEMPGSGTVRASPIAAHLAERGVAWAA